MSGISGQILSFNLARLGQTQIPHAFGKWLPRISQKHFRVTHLARISFAAFVLAPTIVALLYSYFLAAPEYVSEAKIAIRSASDGNLPISNITSTLSSTSAITTAVTGSGAISSTSQDAFIVADYVRGHTIISDIGGKELIHDIYTKHGDWVSRLRKGASTEQIRDYWRWKVVANIDTISSIITLYVRTYRAEDSKRLAELILDRSEALVNAMSERSRQDALKRAEAELQTARERLAKAQQTMLEFRNKTSQISPVLSASTIEETITQLTRDKLALENTRATMFGVVSKESPTRRVLDSQIETINQQIGKLQSALTGHEQPTAIFGQIAGYENLQLEIQFSEKLFAIALGEYEQARADQEKKRLYVVTVVKPNSPEKAAYPKPLRDTALFFMAALIVWSMIALVVASIRDHTM